jgi:hypothetical protein
MIPQISAIPMLTRPIVLTLALSAAAIAQVPQAQAVDPVLAGDSSNDLFLRGKNIYDSAQSATDLANRTEYYQRAAMISPRRSPIEYAARITRCIGSSAAA